MIYKKLNENIITMTYKEFTNWCNDRAIDGRWGYSEASECISIINEINGIPFWKRNKYWRENYEFDIIDKIINKTNKIINEYEEKMRILHDTENCKRVFDSKKNDINLITDNLNNIKLSNIDFTVYEFMSFTDNRTYYNQGIILDTFKLIDTIRIILQYSNKYILNNNYSENYLYYNLKKLANQDFKVLYGSDTLSEILYFQFDENLIKSEINIFEFITNYIIDNHNDYNFIINDSKAELIEHIKNCIKDSDDLNIVDFTKPFLTLEIELNEDDYLLIRFPSDIRLVSFFKQDTYNNFKEYFENNKL